MTIDLINAGRRFNQEWIFRNLTAEFSSAGKYAILGPNGSGKSTLLSVIAGSLSTSEGTITYRNGNEIEPEKVYTHLSLAAPYLDLIEEFTLQETIDFHFQFKSYYNDLNAAGVLDILGLAKSKHKALKYFSSGMRQRTKLALAFCSDTSILILDEPTSNLDQQGISWYQELITNFTQNRMVFVGSNQEIEYAFCEKQINITDYKS